MIAAKEGSEECALILIQYGVDSSAKDSVRDLLYNLDKLSSFIYLCDLVDLYQAGKSALDYANSGLRTKMQVIVQLNYSFFKSTTTIFSVDHIFSL